MYRAVFEHPMFEGEAYSRREAWLWLIAKARWEDGETFLYGKRVSLRRGQVAQSTRELARRWGWSEAKVRRFLGCLKIDAAIDAHTDAGVTVITICNYGEYQADSDDGDAPSDALSDAPATQERRTTKEIEKGNKSTPLSPPTGGISPHELPELPGFLDRRPAAKPDPRGCHLPADWTLDAEDERFAASLGLGRDVVAAEAAKFRDYWHGAAGQNARKRDWRAAWRNWIRKSVEYRARGSPGTRPAASDPLRQASMEVLERDGYFEANGSDRPAEPDGGVVPLRLALK
jgi:hypothetical protein